METLTVSLNLPFSRSHAPRGNAGPGRSASCATARRGASRWRSHAERGNEKKDMKVVLDVQVLP